MPRRLLLLLGVLFTFRAFAIFYAYDHRPMVTSNDEIYWAEPAWALIHGEGYTLPCCKGMLFGDFYPQHPPLYVFILAGSFKLFGFSVAAMRIPSIVAHLVGIILLLALLWRLRRLRVLNQWGFLAAAILALCDFSTLYVARWGRPDPFTTLFALAAFWTLLAGSMKRDPLRRRTWIAAVFIGLSLSTHTIAVFYLGLFALALWTLRSRLGYARLVIALALPCVILTTFWVATFGAKSGAALGLHRDLAKQMGGAHRSPARSLAIATRLTSGSQAEFLQAGGTTAMVILGSFLLFAVRIGSAPRYQLRGWAILGIALAGQALLIIAMTSLGITRCYTYFPFTLVAIGICLSYWTPRPQRIVFACIVLLALMEWGQTSYLLWGTHHDYAARSPDRHAAVIDRLKKYQRVAVIPTLWFQARAQGLDFQLVDLSIPRQHDEWVSKAHPFIDFDAVVLTAEHPLSKSADLIGILPTEFPEPMAAKGLLLYELRPPQ